MQKQFSFRYFLTFSSKFFSAAIGFTFLFRFHHIHIQNRIFPCFERKIGLEAALELLEKCDAVIVGQRYGFSEGMAAEIEKAKQQK